MIWIVEICCRNLLLPGNAKFVNLYSNKKSPPKNQILPASETITTTVKMWKLLPNELRLQILEYLLALKPERLAPYTTFCRPWQHRIDPILFEEVTLYVTTANILSGKTTPSTLADIIRGPRIQDLKKLSIVIDFDPSSFTIVTDGPRRQMQLGAAFADVIDGTFDAMRGWRRDQVYFHLGIHEKRSCGHHLIHYGSKLADLQGKTIDCVRSIRHLEYIVDICRCCSLRGLPAMIFSTISTDPLVTEYGFDRREISNPAMF